MIRGTSHEWTVEDAEVRIGDARFWNCGVEVLVEQETGCVGITARDISGTISFTHPIPESLFFGDDGVPEKLDAVATAETDTERVTLEIEGLFACTEPGDSEIELVAQDADMTVESKCGEKGDDEPTTEETAIRALDDLACEIADGDVAVRKVSVNRDVEPKKRPFASAWRGWNAGPTTLEVVYDDE